MKEPLYRQALSTGWKFTWHHKQVWIFGLFAAMLGQMGVVDVLSRVTLAASKFQSPSYWILLPRAFFQAMRGGTALLAEQWMLIAWASALALGIFALVAFIATASQGALVKSSAQFSGAVHTLPDITAAWHAGVSHFWPLFFLNVVKKAALAFTAIWVAWVGAYAVVSADALVRLSYVGIVLAAVLLGLTISFLAVYAAGYVVVERYSFGRAVGAAWHLFMRHKLVSLEVAGVLLLVNILAAAVLVVFAYLAFLPSVFAWFVATLLNSQTLLVFGLFVGAALLLLAIMFVGASLASFTTCVWTYLFMKMHGHGVVSHLRNMISR